MKPRALISVTDKSGVLEFAQELDSLGYEIVSTGGTANMLRSGGLEVVDVAELTGFPEMLDGRLKTLHPLVHGALLGDVRRSEHREAMEDADIIPISLLCVNLYAFEETVSGEHDFEDAIESIDIGGPAMIRAASKNHPNVTVVVDPEDYDDVLNAIQRDELENLRLDLAAKAFRHTAYYDSMIARYLTDKSSSSDFSETLTVGFRRSATLRYGENPHQEAALYTDPLEQGGLAAAKQLWGKELSYNNINDGNSAWELVGDLPDKACAVIKHGNPCGAAVGDNLGESYKLARECDPISAFGGIAAFHGEIDETAACAMTEKGNFLEVVIGTGFTDKALEIFKERSGWGQSVRLLAAELPPKQSFITIKSIRGGALIQHSDEDPHKGWDVVTETKPTDEQMAALRLMWSVVQHVKSNAIVVGTSNRLLGVGAGQMNRVQSVRLAVEQAGEKVKGSVLASDAFFPFPDSIKVASEAGITAIVQPGGSKKDEEVIAAANELEIAMCFTGTRHFLH